MENNTVVFTQKLPGGQKKKKDNEDHAGNEMKMAIAKSAEEEAGSNLQKAKVSHYKRCKTPRWSKRGAADSGV